MSTVSSATDSQGTEKPTEVIPKTPNQENPITTLVSDLLAPPENPTQEEKPVKKQKTSVLDWIGKKICLKKKEENRDPLLIEQIQNLKALIKEKKETLKNQAGTKFPAVFDLGLGMLTSYIEGDFDGATTHQELGEKIDNYIAILSETFTFISSLQQSLKEKKDEIEASQT